MCSADGNPTPSYEWTQTGNEMGMQRRIYGPVLTIEETMISDNFLGFACTAKNYVKRVSESVTFTVTGLG